MHQVAAITDGAAWRKTASELTALLPAAVTSLLDAASNVAIIPHDVLWRVPFDALPSGDGYLGDHAHRRGGRLGRDVEPRGATRRRVRRARWWPSVRRVLTAPRIERLRQIAPAWSLRTADEAAQEVQAATVDAAPTTTTTTVLAGPAATEPAVREAIGRASVAARRRAVPHQRGEPAVLPVLLTAPEAPPLTAPSTAPTESTDAPAAAPRPAAAVDPANDGALELREVMNVSSAARLALLTDGAATSMRDSAAAADVVEWGWLAAGVPTLVIARWAAPPESRDRLLGEFYKRLPRG